MHQEQGGRDGVEQHLGYGKRRRQSGEMDQTGHTSPTRAIKPWQEWISYAKGRPPHTRAARVLLARKLLEAYFRREITHDAKS